jgi:hypothetical protein
VGQKSEHANPLSRLPANSADCSKTPTLRRSHDGVHALKDLALVLRLSPQQPRVECRISGCVPKRPGIRNRDRSQRETAGVNKLQFKGQAFEIDLHLQLQ